MQGINLARISKIKVPCKIKVDNKIAIIGFVFYMLYNPMRLMTESILGSFFSSILSVGLFVIPLLYAIFHSSIRKLIRLAIFTTALFVILIMTFVLFRQNIKFILMYALTMIYAIFGFYIVSVFKSFNEFEKAFYIGNLSLFFFWQITILTGNLVLEAGGDYSMTFGMSILLPSIYFLLKYSKEKNVYQLLISIVSVCEILLYANKSALITYVFYFGVILFFSASSVKQKIKRFLILLILVFMVYKTYVPFCKLLLASGFNSRTIRSLVNGTTISHSLVQEGRVDLYKSAFSLIMKHPLLGYGVRGDFATMGIYPHNFILELIMNFGIPIALTLIIFYIYSVLHSLKNTDYRPYIILLLVYVFTILLVSLSYWNMMQFWMLIGVLFLSYESVKKNRLLFSY